MPRRLVLPTCAMATCVLLAWPAAAQQSSGSGDAKTADAGTTAETPPSQFLLLPRRRPLDPTAEPDPFAPAEAEDALLMRRVRSPDQIERIVTDPYPVADSVNPDDPSVPDDPYQGLPADLAADGSAPAALRSAQAEDGQPLATGSVRRVDAAGNPLAPGMDDNAVAPLRTVVRPVERANRAALPSTGPIPEPYDPEKDARAYYEPLGIELGSGTLFLTSRGAVGTSTDDGAFWRAEGEALLRSGYDRHGYDITLRAAERRSFSGDGEQPELDATFKGRLDLTEVDQLGLTAGYRMRREESDSSELTGGLSPSDIHTLTASLGYERKAGMVGVALSAGVDRTDYSQSQARANTVVSGSARLTLDRGGLFEPFVEAGTFTRLYDEGTDSAGASRDSFGGEVKAGIAMDTGLVTGTAAVGYAMEIPDGGSLDPLESVIAEVDLAWAATPLATVTLKGASGFEPTQVEGSSGSVTHSLDAGLAYALRPNILVDVGAGLSFQDYFGVNREVTTTRLSAGAAWRFNRTVELGVRATHEITDGSGDGATSGEETTVEAGITLRR